MTAVNLLPHREASRRRRRERWQRHLLLSGLAGCLAAALLFFELRNDIADLHRQLAAAHAQQLEVQRGAQALRQDQGELRTLQARLAALQEQQLMQTAPPAVIAEVARAMPPGMALREMRIEGAGSSHAAVLIEGHAADATAVTDFVNTLAASARVLQSPELSEIASAQVELAGAQPRVQAFSVRARLARALP